MDGLMVHAGATKLRRQDLLALPTPERTETHKPVPDSTLVEGIIESLAYRRIVVASEEYAATPDGMRLLGVLALSLASGDIGLAIAFRTSHDRSFALGLVAGFRVFCGDTSALSGEFLTVSKKHSKNLDVTETPSIGVDRIQRKVQPMIDQVEVWKNHALAGIRAKEIMLDASVGDCLDTSKHLMEDVAREYFNPKYDEFPPRTLWLLQNSFTSEVKLRDSIPMYRASSSIGEYFHALEAT